VYLSLSDRASPHHGLRRFHQPVKRLLRGQQFTDDSRVLTTPAGVSRAAYLREVEGDQLAGGNLSEESFGGGGSDSGVSPDWLIATTRMRWSRIGLRYRNSLAGSISQGIRAQRSIAYLAIILAWKAIPHARVTTFSISRST